MTIEAFLKSSAINTRGPWQLPQNYDIDCSYHSIIVDGFCLEFFTKLVEDFHGAPCYDWVVFLEPGHSEDHILVSERGDEEPVLESDSLD
ncbi:hypothetical protein M378DRAFT_16437 [Amanita muscaria Koide BX008]|uniref:Uncharacterized protein n=1 Tax=Amanita muscaria (strain Koide BX008) TaxID=946122 RepID=A0A0C2W7K7_AMAMK|nr:hypothetical protein M378DRAFT_16437 [Amanita muscaria Koide BX008]